MSHFLREVLELADTITILRDGQVVRTGPAADETEDTLVAAMLGRSIGRTYPPKQPPAARRAGGADRPGPDGGRASTARRSRSGPARSSALAGLVGAGRSELARAIFGAVPATAAELSAGGEPPAGTPLASIRASVAMIPESRKDDGLMLRRPVRENVSLASLRVVPAARLRAAPPRRARRPRGARTASSVASGLETPPAALSGGNQQKLMFARALLANPAVLIADEPTRGVDVGAKRDLYELLVELAAGGVAVLLISNEIEEVLGLAHRVLVMRAGRVVAELAGDDAHRGGDPGRVVRAHGERGMTEHDRTPGAAPAEAAAGRPTPLQRAQAARAAGRDPHPVRRSCSSS